MRAREAKIKRARSGSDASGYVPAPMEWQAWFTLALLVAMVVAMARELAGPDVILMGGLVTLAVAGVITPRETFAGFANESMLTIGALFVLAAALRETGALETVFARVLAGTRSESRALLRMLPPVSGISALLNNTTIVAMMTPIVIDWARRRRHSPSRLLMPLDFATVLGGVVTLIGTSTNLTVSALLVGLGMSQLGFFEISPVGLPVCLAGLAYLFVVAPRLLPPRRDPADEFGERRREYTTSMVVQEAGALVGRTIEEAGLRHLPGLFLVEIDRRGRVLTPVASDERLEGGDRLVFVGVVATIVDLQRIRGLVAATEAGEPPPDAPGRRLTEAVVSHGSPLVGESIRDANFRTVYDAAVVAVHRNGERVGGKIGDIALRAGDTLLLQTSPGFLRAHRNSPDFYLVSEIAGSERPDHRRGWIAIAVLVGLVVVETFGWLPLSVAAFAAAGLAVATRCVSAAEARRSVDWPILIVVGAALGIGTAMDRSGLAREIAGAITAPAGAFGPLAALAVVYLATMVLTEVISNNAAAALMLPIALATAAQIGVDARGFAIAVCIAASCGFATPFGYQTHLIVYGPGGYRFKDFVRVGLPLDLLCAAVAIGVIPLFFGF
jgi:di/tricarboxylate transporter